MDIFDAIRQDDLPRIEALAANAPMREQRGPGGVTPLLDAVAFGSPEAVAALLRAGADANAQTDLGATPLIWAAGDPVKTRLLLGADADVRARSRAGNTPLLVAAARDGGAATVLLLLDRGADPNEADENGVTPLLAGARSGDRQTVEHLLARQCDPNRADKAGMTALQYAAGHGDLAMVRLLLDRGARVNDANVFGGKVKHGDVALKGLTPLMLAAPAADPAVIEALLDAGAAVNAADSRGMTPLMLAVSGETQDRRTVKLLLSRGAEVNAVSAAGETALDWAVRFGDPEVLSLLRQAGAERRAQERPAPKAIERPREVRLAAERAMEAVQSSTAEFFRQSGCVGCHHQNLAMIAASEARAAGLRIDDRLAADAAQQVIAQWNMFSPGLLERMDAPGTPDTPTYSLFGMALEGVPHNPGTDALVANIAAQQHQDGSWRLTGFARAPLEEGHFARTAMAVRALGEYAPAGRRAEMTERTQRAQAWLLANKPRSTDDHAWRLLGLYWTQAPEQQIRRAAKKLLAMQQADGGWAANPYLPSDPLSTATTMWALHTAGVTAADEAHYRRGVDFLRGSQQADGSWFVESRAPKFQPYFESGFAHGPNQWISIAATSWATAALAPAARLSGAAD